MTSPDPHSAMRRRHAPGIVRMLAFGAVAASLTFAPPTNWQFGIRIAKVDISMALQTGSVRDRTAAFDIGQGATGTPVLPA